MFRLRSSIVLKRPADEEVTRILELVRTCQSFQILPREGGLLDQDAYHVYLFNVVANCDYERDKIEKSKANVKG